MFGLFVELLPDRQCAKVLTSRSGASQDQEQEQEGLGGELVLTVSREGARVGTPAWPAWPESGAVVDLETGPDGWWSGSSLPRVEL